MYIDIYLCIFMTLTQTTPCLVKVLPQNIPRNLATRLSLEWGSMPRAPGLRVRAPTVDGKQSCMAEYALYFQKS